MINYKTTIIILLIFLALGCEKKVTKKTNPKPTTTDKKIIVPDKWEAFPLGDIDNDKTSDTAFVYTPSYYGSKNPELHEGIEFDSCVNKIEYNKIRFSNKLPDIMRPNSLWGSIEPIEDLDNDGIKEFIFQTNWWIGSHVTISIYSFNQKSKKWMVLAQNYVYGEDSYKNRIKKMNNQEFLFNIEYMDTIEHDVMKKDTLIKIKK